MGAKIIIFLFDMCKHCRKQLQLDLDTLLTSASYALKVFPSPVVFPTELLREAKPVKYLLEGA